MMARGRTYQWRYVGATVCGHPEKGRGAYGTREALSYSRAMGRPWMMRAGAVIALASAAVVAMPSPVRAADNGSFAVEPSPLHGHTRPTVELSVAPGKTVRDSVTIRNETSASIPFRLYATDAYDDGTGTFVLRGSTEPRRDVGAWVTLPFAEITVPPHGTAVVPFTVTVPATARSGDHAGGIVALSSPGQAGATAPGVNVRAGVGVRIYLRVAGPLTPHLRVEDVHYGPAVSVGSLLGGAHGGTVTYRVVNDGNVRMAPTGSVEITGLTTARDAPTQLPDLLPGASATVTAHIGGVHGAGKESVTVSVAGGATRASAHTSAFVFPYLLILVAAFAVAALIALLLRRRSKISRSLPITSAERSIVAENGPGKSGSRR
jgi:hypothetical protein